jgi:dTDP-4-amino-4,6-dideoxygalactose transaminase
LTRRLEEYLGVENLLLVSNGTLALQIAYHALGINEPVNGKPAEAITTPFTFIATASSLKWDGIQPVFADIDPETWCLDPQNVESAITPATRAIVPVHVFGNACDVDAIDAISQKYKLKVIYDASHAFGVKFKGESLLKHGDAATLSFHATKLFHTVEGGAIVFKRKEDLERAQKMINFGIAGPETIEELGINAKMNELQAAVGICVLDEIQDNLEARARVWHCYEESLSGKLQLQTKHEALSYNYAYFPVVFEREEQAESVLASLKEVGVIARRYFYPSLESVGSLGEHRSKSVSKSVAKRILCLPIFPDLQVHQVKKISQSILQTLES